VTSAAAGPTIVSMSSRKRPGKVHTFGKRLLGFVDILGWSELVRQKRTFEVLSRILHGVTLMEGNVQTETARKMIFERSGLKYGKTVRVGFFSDTLVCSSEPSRREGTLLLDRLQKFCGGLLGNGFLFRGAVVVGDLMHTDRGIIVGEALVDAHDIEQSIARCPRIIVTEEAAPLLVRQRSANRYGPPQVRTDRSDGLRYLDVYPTWTLGRRPPFVRNQVLRAKRILEAVVGRLPKPRRPHDVRSLGVRAKYQWMISYLSEIADDPADGSIRAPSWYGIDPAT